MLLSDEHVWFKSANFSIKLLSIVPSPPLTLKKPIQDNTMVIFKY